VNLNDIDTSNRRLKFANYCFMFTKVKAVDLYSASSWTP